MVRKNKIVLFDTETTGTGEDDQVIQIGSLMLSTMRTYKDEEFVKHDKQISIGAMKVHGIRQVPQSAKKLSKTKTIKRINSLKKGDIVCGHNIEFDLNMTKDVITNDKFSIVDTMIVAEFMKRVNILPEDAGISLQYLRYYWLTDKDEEELVKKYKPVGGAHSALFDVLITNKILEIMVNEIAYCYLDNPDTVWHFLTTLYENRFSPYTVVFPFGKYKGETIDGVGQQDVSYLQWFYDNVDGCERQKKSIEELSKIYEKQGK